MTRQEKLIIIFLIATAIVGLCVSFYKKANRPEIRVVHHPIIAEMAEDKISFKKTININTADANELSRLPGIGPSLAERVISYREQKGLFYFPEDIMDVPGIGKGKFNNIKDLITTEDE